MDGMCTFSSCFTAPLHLETLGTDSSIRPVLRLPQCRSRRINVLCTRNPSPATPPGEKDNRKVLDAFFLGKAFAEALNERIGSTFGEVLSTVGKLQAEQQKQIQDFQDEVLERAKKERNKAAREALQPKGPIPNSSASPPQNNIAPAASSNTDSDSVSDSESDSNSGSESESDSVLES